MEYLKIGSTQIEYELRKSSKAKKVSISIRNCQVRVTVPTGYTFDYARKFLENNKEWILKHFQKQVLQKKDYVTKKYVSGEKLLYRGRNYPLVIENVVGSEFYALFKGSRIVVYIPTGLTLQQQSKLSKSLIEEWYIGQAHKLFPEQMEYYSKLLDIPYKSLKIKDQKTRWGSCSNKGNININWRIVMAPNQVVAYVMIHELTHLRHMDHSKDFWKRVEQYLPDYRKWKKWLAENGKELLG